MHVVQQLLRPAPEDEPLQHLALKANGACIHETNKATYSKLRNSSYRVHVCGLTYPMAQHRGSQLTSTQTFCEGGLSAYLKSSA